MLSPQRFNIAGFLFAGASLSGGTGSPHVAVVGTAHQCRLVPNARLSKGMRYTQGDEAGDGGRERDEIIWGYRGGALGSSLGLSAVSRAPSPCPPPLPSFTSCGLKAKRSFWIISLGFLRTAPVTCQVQRFGCQKEGNPARSPRGRPAVCGHSPRVWGR